MLKRLAPIEPEQKQNSAMGLMSADVSPDSMVGQSDSHQQSSQPSQGMPQCSDETDPSRSGNWGSRSSHEQYQKQQPQGQYDYFYDSHMAESLDHV